MWNKATKPYHNMKACACEQGGTKVYHDIMGPKLKKVYVVLLYMFMT